MTFKSLTGSKKSHTNRDMENICTDIAQSVKENDITVIYRP